MKQTHRLLTAAACLAAAFSLTSAPAEGARLEANLVLKNGGHGASMRCTLYHVAHYSDRRKRAIKHFSVPERSREVHRVTLPNRPLSRSRRVRTLPSAKYRPKLQLMCRYRDNKNHWKWGPMWSTKDKPVDKWRQESFCRDGSPCGIYFEEIDGT